MEAASFAMAYAFSTSVGIRPFLTLAIASLAIHMGWIHTAHQFAYLGTDVATWIFAGLAALELAADKFPVVDHTLHVIHFATKPVAALLLVGTALPDAGAGDLSNPLVLASDAMVGAGALNALGVHAGVTALRGASTGMTFGIANPVISVIEDITSVVATVLAMVLPWLAAAIAVMISVALVLIARWLLLGLRRRAATTA